MPPEVHAESSSYCPVSADLWSIGLLTVELLTGVNYVRDIPQTPPLLAASMINTTLIPTDYHAGLSILLHPLPLLRFQAFTLFLHDE